MRKEMRKSLVIGCMALLICLTGCQGSKGTTAEKYWKAAGKMNSLEEYVKENRNELDMDVLKAEADSSESTLVQRFKAVAFMSMLEYQQNAEDKDAMFLVDYPVSGPCVEAYLAKVNTEGEAFWNSLEDTFYPYDCFAPMMAAADNLGGQTLMNLLRGIPADSRYEDRLISAIDKWVKNNPAKITEIGDDLLDIGYFDEWDLLDWKNTYFYGSNNSYRIKTDTGNEGLAYINYLGTSILPMLEDKYGSENLRKESELTGEAFYSTQMAVAVDEELNLQEPVESSLPETIELQGKKVVAFYRNLQSAQFEGSPAPLRLMGDFMINLPEEERPKTLGEADYYLVLTADYKYGGYYKDSSGKDLKIRETYSSTSVDLYEAETGRFLRHLGNVMELSAANIVSNLSEEGERYPELVSSDALYQIYQNVNQPEAYITLTDNTYGLKGDLEKGQPIVIGNWEITYHSGQVTKEFEKGMYLYAAKDGFQLVRGRFTITNRGSRKETFMPTIRAVGGDTRRETSVQVTDGNHKNYYDTIFYIDLGGSLNGAFLEPGETREGELVFQVPEEVVQAKEPLFICVFAGYQEAFYPVD